MLLDRGVFMKMQWIKLSTDVFQDEKIRLIEAMPEADSILIIWFKLLTLAGRMNCTGKLEFDESTPLTNEMLATLFNRDVEIVEKALSVFETFGMIERGEDEPVKITNWENHQSVESADKKRAQTRKRVADFRAKQQNFDDVTQCNASCNADVTQCNAVDIDKEKDIEKENIYIARGANENVAFVKPTAKQIDEYKEEARIFNVDTYNFLDYYEACGWKVGNKPMQDWKATLRGWSRRGRENTQYKRNGKSVDNGNFDDVSKYYELDLSPKFND